MFRIGLGYDIHKLVEEREFILGGVEIPFEKGLLGHSDADVLVHAIIDALLGALALHDIGTLFPDTDIQYKNADSVELLKSVYELIKEKRYQIANLDTNVIAQAPKLMPYIDKIRENLALALEIETDKISVKAKTKEGLDSVGAKEAIEAQAIVLLMSRECD